MKVDELVDAVMTAVKDYILNTHQQIAVYATWVAQEMSDGNLSEIQFPDGTTAHGVPKLEHVTSLNNGDQVMCLNTGGSAPLTIIGKVVGDITVI